MTTTLSHGGRNRLPILLKGNRGTVEEKSQSVSDQANLFFVPRWGELYRLGFAASHQECAGLWIMFHFLALTLLNAKAFRSCQPACIGSSPSLPPACLRRILMRKPVGRSLCLFRDLSEDGVKATPSSERYFVTNIGLSCCGRDAPLHVKRHSATALLCTHATVVSLPPLTHP